MKLVLQRVSEASVTVDEKVVAAIGKGLLVLLCVEHGDSSELAKHYAGKVVELRIFADDAGKMNRSIQETGGEILVISQFTLAADAEKGRRPSFIGAAEPELATRLYEEFTREISQRGIRVATGVFGAFMKVALINDGPVTILLGKRNEPV